MDADEVTDWLHEQLGSPLSDDEESLLREDGYLHIEGDTDLEGLLVRAQRLRKLREPGPGTASRPARTRPSNKTLRALAQRDQLRRDALSEYWAKDAGTAREVRRFREEVIGSQLMSKEEAVNFLTSEAALKFSVEDLKSRGIDPARHRAKVVEEEATYRGAYRAVIEIDSGPLRLEFARASTRSNPWDGTRPLGTEVMNIRIAGGAKAQAHAWPGSIVDLFRKVTESLERQRYPWQAGDAAWFILTGQVPLVPAIGHLTHWQIGSHGTRVTFEIRVEPWVSVTRVAALYRDLQAEIIGRHNRPISDRRIALFRFVTSHLDDAGELPTWRLILDEWNGRHRQWAYKNVRNFSRDYWAAARQLLFPRYNLPAVIGGTS